MTIYFGKICSKNDFYIFVPSDLDPPLFGLEFAPQVTGGEVTSVSNKFDGFLITSESRASMGLQQFISLILATGLTDEREAMGRLG